MRLLRARAVKRDGAVVEAGSELDGAPFVLSIGPTRFYRVELRRGEKQPRLDTRTGAALY